MRLTEPLLDIAMRAYCDEWNRMEGGDFYRPGDAQDRAAVRAAVEAALSSASWVQTLAWAMEKEPITRRPVDSESAG